VLYCCEHCISGAFCFNRRECHPLRKIITTIIIIITISTMERIFESDLAL
jgi:hypothetical protein